MKMNYRNMVAIAKEKGVATEKAMFNSIDRVNDLLEELEESHPDVYWEFMRKSHEDLYGDHYDCEFAKYDVNQMFYTDKEGKHHNGQYWSVEDIRNATTEKVFPQGTTDWDKYYAYNAIHADLCKAFSDADILEIAYLFFFADEDGCDGKAWKYGQMNSK